MIWSKDKNSSNRPLHCPACYQVSVQWASYSDPVTMSRWLPRPATHWLRTNLGSVKALWIILTWCQLDVICRASIQNDAEHHWRRHLRISRRYQGCQFVISRVSAWKIKKCISQWWTNKISDEFSSQSLSTGSEATGVTCEDSEKQTEVYYFYKMSVVFCHFSY